MSELYGHRERESERENCLYKCPRRALIESHRRQLLSPVIPRFFLLGCLIYFHFSAASFSLQFWHAPVKLLANITRYLKIGKAIIFILASFDFISTFGTN